MLLSDEEVESLFGALVNAERNPRMTPDVEWQHMRWNSRRAGDPMPIVFYNKRGQFIANKAAVPDVRDLLMGRKFDSPRVIFLQPECDGHDCAQKAERLWCEDDLGCTRCGRAGIRYCIASE